MARSFPTLSLILSLLSAPIFLSAQNIVPNGKLDSVNICTEYKAPCCPAGWFFTARPRSGGVYGKPAHVLQFITARNDKSTRQYWQTYLLCPLQPGTKYRIRIKVASNYIGPNLHDLGLYFTDHFIYSQGDTLMQPDYYIGFMDAKYTELKAYWFQLEKTFTALERKQVLIIGNFSSESNRHITRQRHLDK